MHRRKKRLSAIVAFLAGTAFMQLAGGPRLAIAEVTDQPCVVEPSVSQGAEVPVEMPTPPPPTLGIRFSEVLPDPSGKDTDGEFIEVENPSDIDADITGWRIADAKGKTYVIPEVRIAARGSHAFVYAETKIPLVNVAASYVLQDVNGVTVDTASYPSPVPEKKSYARFDGGWRWTETPTPGNANVFSEAAPTPILTAPPPVPAPEIPAPVEEETPITAIEPTVLADLTIDEFLPNPDGDDAIEWIELRNVGTNDGSLVGWTIDDGEGGSTPHAFANEIVTAGTRFVAHRSVTRIALNNDSDEVRLIAPDGSVRQRVRYEDAPSGKSFSYDGATWRWTSPTPREPNAFEGAAPPVAATSVPVVAAAALPADEEAVIGVTLEDISAIDDDTTVTVSAIVTLPPGVIGKTILAVRDSEGTHGAFVRLRGRAAVPTLRPGDVVLLRGRVRRENGSTLSVNTKDVVKTGHDARATTLERDPAGVTEDDAGLSVTVTGTVTSKGKGWVRLGSEGDGTEIRGTFPNGVATGLIDIGDATTMTGIVRIRSGKPEIIMLEKSSFTAKKPTSAHHDSEPVTTANMTQDEHKTIVLSSSPKSPIAMMWSIAALVAVGGAIAGYALWRRKRFA